MFKFFYTLIISPVDSEASTWDSESRKFKNILFRIISVLPPNVFMFYLYSKNAEHIDYWHIFILAALFSCLGFLMHLIISRAGKSLSGSAFVCVFLWIMFFTVYPLYRNLNFLYNSALSVKAKIILLLIIVLALAVIIFIIGRRLKHIKIFKTVAVFEIVLFLIIFIQATGIYISKIIFSNSETNYKTAFTISDNSPRPNIYWVHMDGMLGFNAMEYFFHDAQKEFETQLKERGFVVNRDAHFEANHYTTFAIPILMCPFYYDKIVLPLLKSINLSDLSNKRRHFDQMANSFNKARWNNELIGAFNAKGYQTGIITDSLGYYWHPITRTSYTPQGKIEYKISYLTDSAKLEKLTQLNFLMSRVTISIIFLEQTQRFIDSLYQKRLNIEPIKKAENNTKGITEILSYKDTTWYIDALSEVFESPQPRMTIIVDEKAHFPFVLNEDGFAVAVTRSEKEFSDIYNYPPQHRFSRKYLITLIDFILANDPESIIVVQADHGLHHSNSQRQIFSSGGSIDEVCLIYNQVMSTVRMPDMWGGMDAPLDPLNITRVLVNRYVGQNYELLENHP